jgi:Fe/S biogenesis protein NfuA
MRRKIQTLIDEMINPAVASHGGAVELVDYVNNKVFVRMTGGCQGCASSTATLKSGIERLVKEEFPDIKAVVDVTNHEEGTNPYYT